MATYPLLPALLALACWTHVIWVWMYATRLPAIARLKMRMDPEAPRGSQMAQLPARVRWKADNYNHLFEQPTVFYAVVLAASLIGGAKPTDVGLAWAYVLFRVLHSLWQVLRNHIPTRFALFSLSAACLIALSVRTALRVF